jgi:hypothetical protein
MNPERAILASFLGACAIISWRDFTNPDPNWPLPAPPPYRYVGAAVAFGLLAIFADTVSPKIGATLAVGLLVGLGFQTAQERGSGKGIVTLPKKSEPADKQI